MKSIRQSTKLPVAIPPFLWENQRPRPRTSTMNPTQTESGRGRPTRHCFWPPWVSGLAIVLAYAGPSWALAFLRLILDGGCLFLWLAAATGFGIWLLRFFEPPANPLHYITATALGLGLLSLITLLLGLIGLLKPDHRHRIDRHRTRRAHGRTPRQVQEGLRFPHKLAVCPSRLSMVPAPGRSRQWR